MSDLTVFFFSAVLISVMSMMASDVGRGHELTDLDVDGADADAAATGLHRSVPLSPAGV